MAKSVYTGQEVPHLFAADKKASARNSNGTLYCRDGVLYSYRHSAPIAAWHGDIVLLNGNSYSVTTSKHQAWTRYAVNHLQTLTLPDLRQVIENFSDNAAAEYIAKRVKEIEAIRAKIAKSRSESRKAGCAAAIADLESACAFVWNTKQGKKTPWQSALRIKAKNDKAEYIRRYTQARNQLEAGLENAGRMIERARELMLHDLESGRTHGLQSWWRLDNAAADIRRIDSMGARFGAKGVAATATFTHAAKLMGAKWAKECMQLAAAIADFADSLQPEIDASRKEYDAAQRLSNAEKVAQWYAGQNVGWPLTETACRVVGDEVQTSRGARVPLAAALPLVDLAKSCRAVGRPMDLGGRQIGAYRGTSISAAGDLKIGCHVIIWEAVESCFNRYQESL